ncbi:MAG: matrixin family metalloprotease [Deltaproteobacteria bacterium]|nr:matrixin family metalloprotease [Deltaproteobacteria bacterium]
MRSSLPGVARALPPVVACALLLAAPASAYEVNGRHWDAMPIPYHVNPAGAPDFGDGRTPERVVADAIAPWAAVGCASISFEYQGSTDATYAQDGRNTIYWVTKDWPWGKGAAGATLWHVTDPGTPPEVDLALNAEEFEWRPGGGDATQADVVDPASVIAHEVGHWIGLAHSPHQFATMYQALLPAGMQASLDGDDRAGACAMYPSGEPDCATDADCGDGHACREVAGVTVCDEVHDPVGAPCDKRHLNCDDMCFISFYECSSICAFTAGDYSEGYCAKLCGKFGQCPGGYDCAHLVSPPVAVCLREEPGDPGPEPIADSPPDPEPVPDPDLEPDPEPDPEPVPDNGPEPASTSEHDLQSDPTPSAPGAHPASSGCAAGAVPSMGTALLLLLLLLAPSGKGLQPAVTAPRRASPATPAGS